MKAHGTETDKLADVIQILQMTGKTGLLIAQRENMYNVQEQGKILFNSGHITDASVGTLRGDAALSTLMIWQACHFVFQTAPEHNTASSLPVPSADNYKTPRNAPTRELSSGPLTSPRTGPLADPSSGPLARQPSGPLAPIEVVPCRVHNEVNGALSRFNSLGLSRTHRQLFLLIDGQRTVQELKRLMGHRPVGTDTLLFDLERAGLIYQANRKG